MNNRFNIKSFLWNLLIVNLLIASLYEMAFSNGQALTANTFSALKYYTVQSNILAGVASFISLIFIVFKLKYPKWLVVFKLISTCSVFLTFTTCVVYLGPAIGYLAIFSGVNLIMHLFTPLAAIFQFIFDEPKADLKFWHNGLSTITMLLYGIFYFVNIALHNGFGNLEYDWYGFGMFGPAIGAVLYVVMAGVIFGLSCILYFSYKKMRR